MGANDGPSSVESLSFFDDTRSLYYSYDPSEIYSMSINQLVNISPNQELIGVYGVRDTTNDHFSSFGFLVKEKKSS